jgi:hypothetical protein
MQIAVIIEGIGEGIAVKQFTICVAEWRETYDGRRVYVLWLQPPEEV